MSPKANGCQQPGVPIALKACKRRNLEGGDDDPACDEKSPNFRFVTPGNLWFSAASQLLDAFHDHRSNYCRRLGLILVGARTHQVLPHLGKHMLPAESSEQPIILLPRRASRAAPKVVVEAVVINAGIDEAYFLGYGLHQLTQSCPRCAPIYARQNWR